MKLIQKINVGHLSRSWSSSNSKSKSYHWGWPNSILRSFHSWSKSLWFSLFWSKSL